MPNIYDFIRALSLGDSTIITENALEDKLSSEAIHAASLYDQHNPARDIKEFATRYLRGEEDSGIKEFLSGAKIHWRERISNIKKSLTPEDLDKATRIERALERMRSLPDVEEHDGKKLDEFWKGVEELSQIQTLSNNGEHSLLPIPPTAIVYGKLKRRDRQTQEVHDEAWTGMSYLHAGWADTSSGMILLRKRAISFMSSMLIIKSKDLGSDEQWFAVQAQKYDEQVYWHERGEIEKRNIFGNELSRIRRDKTAEAGEEYADLAAAVLIKESQGNCAAISYLLFEALIDSLRPKKNAGWKIQNLTIDARKKRLEEEYLKDA